MALQIESIDFVLRAGTGSQTIPLVQYPSMTPKAIVFCIADSADASPTRPFYGYGFDDGTTHIGNSVSVTETFGTALSARGYYSTYSVVAVTAQAAFGGVSSRVRGYVSALNVGSFDITIDVNLLPGSGWTATVIGGDDVECAVGIYDVSAGSGTVNVGFDPVALMKLSAPLANGEVSGAYHDYGFATDCSSDQQVGWGISVNSITSASTSYQIDGVIQQDIGSGSTTLSSPVTVAFVANGFSVTTSGTPDWNIGYLAIGGTAVSANLVQIVQPTSAGVQNTAIDATDPVAVFFGSTCKPATAGAGNVDANLMFGVYDGVSQRSFWLGTVNGASFPYRYSATHSATKSVGLYTATGPNTRTENASATCALSSQNIALTWTSADATQREVWALALAQNLTGSSNPCGTNPQASITVIKQTTPIPGGSTQFPFGTTGGLSPATFTLTDGASQLFSALSSGTYGITESAPTGWTASYEVSNDDPHDAIVISGTEAVTVTVTNTFQSSPTGSGIFRVLRRWALPYDGNKKIFIPRIEIIAQMGVGDADDPAPVMSLRISPDGGETWGPYRDMPLGASGDTMIRAYLTRFCQGLRNPVAELICDSPVVVAWVSCELPQDFTVGTS